MGQKWIEVPGDPNRPLEDDERLVKTLVRIRKNDTGEIREYEDTILFINWMDLPRYEIWQDGNFGCDCNRRLFFARAGDEEEDMEGPCGTGQYSVELINPANGVAYYSEMKS